MIIIKTRKQQDDKVLQMIATFYGDAVAEKEIWKQKDLIEPKKAIGVEARLERLESNLLALINYFGLELKQVEKTVKVKTNDYKFVKKKK
jgi:hypothetical protein